MGDHKIWGVVRSIGVGLGALLIFVVPVTVVATVGPRLHMAPLADVFATLGIYVIGFVLWDRRQKADIREQMDKRQTSLRREEELRLMSDVAYRRGREDQARAESPTTTDP